MHLGEGWGCSLACSPWALDDLDPTLDQDDLFKGAILQHTAHAGSAELYYLSTKL